MNRSSVWAMALLIGLGLLSCTTQPVIKEVIQTVNVPVRVECLGEVPQEVTPLKEVYTREQWDQLTTDQRNNIIIAQGLDRRAYGERMAAASAGCLKDGP